MNITSLIDIVGGELKNSPSISSFYNIKLDANKVLEGDLFIAKNDLFIEKAIKNGAFVIIFDFETKVLDNEIAWIKVDNIKQALIKILRFKLSPLSINVFYCDSFTYELIDIYKNSLKSTFLLSSKSNSILNILNNINSIESIFSNDKDLLSTIYPACKVLRSKEYKIKNLIKHSLFETSFSYRNDFYTKIKLPALYINSYLKLIHYFNIELDNKKLNKQKVFNPIFVDKYLNVVEYGKSSKFLIAQNLDDLVVNEIDYLKKNFTYGKILYISRFKIPGVDIKVLKRIKDIKKYLQNEEFNAVYIIGYKAVHVEKYLELSSMKKTKLF